MTPIALPNQNPGWYPFEKIGVYSAVGGLVRLKIEVQGLPTLRLDLSPGQARELAVLLVNRAGECK